MLEILRAFVGIPKGVLMHRTERHSSQLSANVFILSSLRSTQFYKLWTGVNISYTKLLP